VSKQQLGLEQVKLKNDRGKKSTKTTKVKEKKKSSPQMPYGDFNNVISPRNNLKLKNYIKTIICKKVNLRIQVRICLTPTK